MADKQWYMEWHVGDWLKDPAVTLLKPATRGVWFDAINVMHESGQCGQIEGTVNDLARLCRCTPGELRSALDDLKLRNAAEIGERVTDGNVRVTLRNRRMYRIYLSRKSNRERVIRHRARKCNGLSNANVTADVAPLYTTTITTTPDPPSPPVGGDGVLEFWDQAPERIRTPEVRAAWADWLQHRRERKPKVTPLAAKKSLSDLAAMGPERAVAAINHSIAKGWQGIFEARVNGHGSNGNGRDESEEAAHRRARAELDAEMRGGS